MNEVLSRQGLVKVALIGNPNSGKTSVFNRLTGLNQKVGNFPGVTVDKKTGSFSLNIENQAKLIDLPGAYSLYPTSVDERIVLDILTNKEDDLFPDVIVYVADATNLERHLLLLSQVQDLDIPIILALNMADLADKGGYKIDSAAITKKLGVTVVETNGRSGFGTSEIKKAILNKFNTKESNCSRFKFDNCTTKVIEEIKSSLSIENDYQAILYAHHYQNLGHLGGNEKSAIEEIIKKNSFSRIKAQVDETMARFDKIVPLVEKVVVNTSNTETSFTEKLDKILTHKVFGSIIFISILLLVFQAIFAWSSYPMDLIDEGFAGLTELTKLVLPNGVITNLITDGIIAGLGGVLIFIPQITILFLLVALLEEIGYMSRAVFLSDSIMRKFGLNGRSIVSLISGVACAVPAIMATRSIGDWKERLITIMVTPLMSCSARIPVFTVLVGFAVPQEYYFGIFNLQGLVVMGLYIAGATAAILSAFVMKQLLKTSEISYLVMELPTYKMPHWKNVGITVFEKVKTFVFEAGKIILIISIFLWFLASYGPGDQMVQVEQQVATEASAQNWSETKIEDEIASRKIEVSFAGYLGKAIEPVIEPLGFDWKMGIAIITSFAAREVFVGTMATIYSVGSSGDDEQSVVERMANEVDPETGELVYNQATSFSLLIFYLFAMQCMSTLAIVKRETKSWKWPTIQLIYMTGLAYFSSLIVYNIFS
ncbi:MAG: ferrous iron transport protein B [Flammeovirgaceae bacterium]|nr:ferrous iron transport protein B [Flammeovirgaceae bacterium]